MRSLLVAAATLHLINRTGRFLSAFTVTDPSSDPSMTAINAMIERGDLWGASARIGSSYRFDKPAGLMALRSFSVLVLRRGLQEYDPYERCYASERFGRGR